jgi:hypothetical protein
LLGIAKSKLSSQRVALRVLVGLILASALWDGSASFPQSAAVLAAEGEPAQTPPPDPLLDLNSSFRSAYAQSRKQLLEQSGPVILVEGDEVVLLRGGKRTVVRAIPEMYHTLKAVSHVPLAVYVLLISSGDGKVRKELLSDLGSLREKISQAEKSLPGRGLSAAILQRQQEILAAALHFLDNVLGSGEVKQTDLVAFARKLAPLVIANAADAAQVQLSALNRQVTAWREGMPAADWERLRVVVMGSPLPRQGNLAVQYFARILGIKGEDARLVYAESVFEENRALNLLGTHLLDTKIGVAFFDDPQRMHRDLLADAAEDWLKANTVNEELRRELAAMRKLDQDARFEMIEAMKKSANTDAGALKKNAAPPGFEKIEEIDRKNTARLKEIMANHGWPGKSLVGRDGANTAWLLVQHADKDREFQKKCLGLMKAALAKGEVSAQDVAYLTDRVLVGENKKQLYGTQCTVVNGQVKFQPIEDEANVDKRRAEVGLPSLTEYRKMIEQMYKARKQ